MIAVAMVAASCSPSSSDKGGEKATGTEKPAQAKAGEKIVIGLVAKSQSNPVFQAAYSGAKDAAAELAAQYGHEVVIDWQTPADEDAQKQAQAIEQLARAGAKGIIVSCSDANAVTPAINKAVELGAVVMCFDSDAPKSKRFCFYGAEDITCGKVVMEELARVMDGKGTVAILTGNLSAPNLQNRVKGAQDELAKHPDMKLVADGVFHLVRETPEDAAEEVRRAQTTNPTIQGWAMIGGWPLFTKDALRWDPGSIKVVAVDALPAELPYLESGHVEALYAQDCYGWGTKSVKILLDKIVNGKDPEKVLNYDPLTRVTKDTAKAYGEQWKKWAPK
jgi:ribose transport system substrate-binding protein